MTQVYEEIEDLLPDLKRFAMSLTHDAVEADDLVQDCVVRALTKESLYEQNGKLKPWLFTMMRNVFISQKRKEAVARKYIQMADFQAARTERPSQIARVALNETLKAVDRLAPGERDAVMQLGVEDMSHEEAAARSNIPVGTVKSRLSRGRAHLRTMMDLEGALVGAA